MSCGIEPDEEGLAGIRLTARGSITTCPYGMDTDGRTHLNSVGWKSFLVVKNLQDDGRHRHHLELHMHACGC